MAITLKEIITIDEYLEVFPQDQAVEEDLIQSAINRAVMTLDGICGGMIAKVWDVTVTTDPLYRTEEEKGFIKQAHLLQAQYNISRNLDMSAGSESYTSGSNNYNETRPRADLVADEVIYQLLAQARVYNPNITTDTTITGDKLNSAGGFYDPTYDPLDNYVTYNVGDLRYIMKNTNNTDKFLHTDSNGNVDYVTISASPTGTSSAIANFITIAGVEYQLGGAATWGGITGNIEDQQDLQQALSNKQDTLIAGENITIENNVISATGGGSYTAGNGLQLSNNEFSIDEQVTATKTDLSRKQDLLTTISGYDPTKIQCLYNNYGTLLWSKEKPHWWDDVSSLTAADIGTTREVEVNGVTHTVRLIGVDHDDLADGSGKAHTTWQFTNILSDGNGYSLATFWKDTNDTSTANYDFTNSDIRKALDGEGTGTANWFVKSETTWNPTYSGKSVLDMLPTLLVSKLKSVSKQIATTSSYTVGTYDTKLFIPSYREITATGSSQYAKEEGTTYSYWASHDTNTDRIKQQVKGTDGALTSSTQVTSGAYTGTKYSYAGYNSSTSGYGGITWLRSPVTNSTSYAWRVRHDGYLSYDLIVYYFALGVAPCFCL